MTHPLYAYRRAAILRGRVAAAGRQELALDDNLTEVDPANVAAYIRSTWKITPILNKDDKTIAGWRVYHRGRWVVMVGVGDGRGNHLSREDALVWLREHVGAISEKDEI